MWKFLEQDYYHYKAVKSMTSAKSSKGSDMVSLIHCTGRQMAMGRESLQNQGASPPTLPVPSKPNRKQTQLQYSEKGIHLFSLPNSPQAIPDLSHRRLEHRTPSTSSIVSQDLHPHLMPCHYWTTRLFTLTCPTLREGVAQASQEV